MSSVEAPDYGDRPLPFDALVILSAQLAGLAWVLYRYRLVSEAFERLFLLAAGGFLVHSLLPLRDRLGFFVLLSGAAVLVVLGVLTGGVLLAIGGGLILLCHLPIRLGFRVALLAAAGGVLAAARGGWLPLNAPSVAPMWPVLGSMFMFRIAIYLYDREYGGAPGGPRRVLAYFFLLPNVCFPLFPVVDYKTYCRSYYNAERYAIYQRGVRVMLLGVLHLLAYRLVKYHLVIDPAHVTGLASLGRSFVTGYLLYLRVSGDFHVITGLLHLFGFNLPPTHRFFFFARNFADLARRINIYWKDFMQKMVFFPVLSVLRRRLGTRPAVACATLLVFVATWFLHAYQWFWIRGAFPLSVPDALFWAALAVLVLAAGALESSRPLAKASGGRVRTVASVVATFTVMSVLWSVWNSESLGEWLRVVGTAIHGVG